MPLGPAPERGTLLGSPPTSGISIGQHGVAGPPFEVNRRAEPTGTQQTVPRASFQQLPVQRRAEILAIAAEEFGERGFQATSYNQLLQRLGIGKSSAYHYFEDKADSFRSAVAESYAKWFRSSSPLTQPETREEYWPYIRELNENGFRFMLEDPALPRCCSARCARRPVSNECWALNRCSPPSTSTIK